MIRRVVREIPRIVATAVVAVVLVTLKATGSVNWAWVWILAPIWAGLLALPLSFVVFAVSETFRSPTQR